MTTQLRVGEGAASQPPALELDEATPLTVADILQQRAAAHPEAVALAAPARKPLAYAGLLREIGALLGALHDSGLQRGDRVAVVLPDSPELALAFLAVSSGLAAAPLNPRYRGTEFEFYLTDLKAKAVITGMGADDSVREAADAIGLPVIEVAPDRDRPAGCVFVDGVSLDRRKPAPLQAAPDDLALLLHTSGTTARPKLVPLTHRNLVAVAHNKAGAFGLEPVDCCLCPMPLFHMHGLAALLGTALAGGSIACTGFIAPSFFDWVQELQPTWYTAVPTMHQSIIARAPLYLQVVAAHHLRFLRSGSSALAPTLRAELEQLWGVPVVDSYGLIEASSSTSTRPFPFAKRPPGSVGQPTGTEIAIADEHGGMLPAGQAGEILIRGDNVTRGYEDNPEANAAAFRDGWLRTGDEGYLDEEGYLFVCGRIKEIINRGGEKISPREVDEALLTHPAVAQAAAFAIPDPRLGEEVGAAVVLREGATVDEVTLRMAVAGQLADFKVPRRIVFVPELPRGGTGKVQRLGLAEKLGITSLARPETAEPAPYVAPRTPTEEALVAIWTEVLGLEQVGINDDFIELGGDSILSARLIARVRAMWNHEMSLVECLEHATVAGQAALIEAKAQV